LVEQAVKIVENAGGELATAATVRIAASSEKLEMLTQGF